MCVFLELELVCLPVAIGCSFTGTLKVIAIQTTPEPLTKLNCVLVLAYALAVYTGATHRSPVCRVCDIPVSGRVPVRSAPDQRHISHQHQPVGCTVHVSMSHTAADRVPGRELTAASVALAEASYASCSKCVTRGPSSQQASLHKDDSRHTEDFGSRRFQAAWI